MLYSVYVSSPAQSVSNGLGQTQLIMLLPEIGPYLPTLIRKVIFNLREVLLSFEFLGLHSLSIYKTLKDTFGYDIPQSEKNYSVTLNGSSILNLFNWLGGALIFIGVFLLFWVLKGVVKEENEEKWYGKMIKRCSDFMKYGLFIWIIKYTYLYILFT